MPLVVSAAAEADIQDAFAWYDRRGSRLGQEFLSAVVSAAALIDQSPQLYAPVYRDVRRARLRRFPYALFYRVVDDVVVVFACMHLRRNPRRWMDQDP
jgi:plasmid stabilization system protein ParE